MGELNEERHMQGFVVEKKPVASFPMLTEGLAMIGGDRNQAAFV